MPRRFFVESRITSDRASLVGPEAHHLAHVMRAREGNEVVLFDGSGAEFTARIESVGRSEVGLAVLAKVEIDRESPRECTLAVALPKGDRQAWLVEKAVELGVSRLVPLTTTRGVAQPTDKAIERLRRAVIEASKQCGRNRLMTIELPRSVPELTAQSPRDASRFVAHPGGKCLASTDLPQGPLTFAVGPEGGFTDDEVRQALDAGWQTIGLGPRILRIETAALYLAALAAAHV